MRHPAFLPPTALLFHSNRTVPASLHMALANNTKAARPMKLPKSPQPLSSDPNLPYIGTPSPGKPGRLRLNYAARFPSPTPPPPPPAETRQDRAWQRANYVSRSLAIWSFIARLLSNNWLDAQSWTYWLGKRTDEKVRDRRRRLAAFARERILRLGPTMIKVGQLASTRADILPREVIDELQALQDRVPAFDWKIAEQLLEEQYGRPVHEVFSYFDKRPLAAASLGQVHRARLWGGEHVVVKIQRPRLKRLFDLDLYALKVVAEYLQTSKKYGGNGRDWVAIYEECANVLYQEIDYIREAESCERFGDNFSRAGISYVKVPKVYKEYTTGTVLCLQYLPGIKISDIETLQRANLDLKLVASRIANAFIVQVLDHAFFTCDPHPGNCAVGANESIIFYDFGMMGELNPNIKKRLIDILAGVLDRDAQIVMDALVDLKALVLPPDVGPVKRSIQFFLDSVGNRPSREQTVSAIGDDLYATAYDKPFRLPAASIFLLRAFSTLEGLARGLDSDFKFSDIAFPYAGSILQERASGLQSAQQIVRSLASSVISGRSNAATEQLTRTVVGAGSDAVKTVGKIQKIERTLAQLESGEIKVRSRSTETEKLLRKQNSLTEASNYLILTGTTALAAMQLYASGLMEAAAVMTVFSAGLGLTFLRKQAKVNKKDRFS